MCSVMPLAVQRTEASGVRCGIIEEPDDCLCCFLVPFVCALDIVPRETKMVESTTQALYNKVPSIF
jgi:hypothetical protein